MDKPIRRFNIFLPVNDNTKYHLDDILSIIKGAFSGVTFSQFHDPPILLGDKAICGYFRGKYETFPDEDICYIIFDVPISEYPSVYDDVSVIQDIIHETDEKEVWLTYNDIMLHK